MEFNGSRLRALRKDRQIRMVARELGVTESALRAYESGKRRPRDEVLNRMVLFYGVPLSYLGGPVFLHSKCTDSACKKGIGKKSIFLIKECTYSA